MPLCLVASLRDVLDSTLYCSLPVDVFYSLKIKKEVNVLAMKKQVFYDCIMASGGQEVELERKVKGLRRRRRRRQECGAQEYRGYIGWRENWMKEQSCVWNVGDQGGGRGGIGRIREGRRLNR